MSGWNLAYDSGTPPWDIGRAQPAVLRLADAGAFRSPVLDAGCGTGENSLALAERGLEVVGLDGASSAIRRAEAKALGRGVAVRFVVGNALDLVALGMTFGSVVDCGLFHTFGDEERLRYVDELRRVVAPGGSVCLLCFSDEEPWGGGPRRVSQREIRDCFADGWRVVSIAAERFATRIREPGYGARAWLARIERAVARAD